MPDLTLILVQAEAVWEHPAASLARIDLLLPERASGIDLIILPEMFATGFSMHPAALAETMEGPSVCWLRARAASLGVHLCGSLIICETGRFYNRLLWATPQGELWIYDKRHLFRMAGEDRVYQAGARRMTVLCNGWRIRPFICYDLRFPVWTRNTTEEAPFDLAVFVANWPASRSAHWSALLRARAIENQCFVAGVNRVGVDGNGLDYRGDSMVIDPLGDIRLQVARQACAVPVTLAHAELEACRQRFPFLGDADRFRLEGDLAGGDGEV